MWLRQRHFSVVSIVVVMITCVLVRANNRAHRSHAGCISNPSVMDRASRILYVERHISATPCNEEVSCSISHSRRSLHL